MSDTIEWAPRLRLAAIVVSLLVVVPLVVAWALGGTIAAVGTVAGSAMTAAGAMAEGTSATRFGIPALIVGFGAGALLAGTWLWVVLVAAIAGSAGLAAAAGATMSVMFGAVLAAVAPAADLPQASVLALFTALGCAYGLLLVVRTGAPAGQPPEYPVEPALLGAAFAGVAAAAAAIALAVDDPRATWIPMTALVLTAPASTGISDRSRERIVGTLVGAAIAIAIGLVSPPPVVVLAITVGALLMVIATAGLRYRVQAAFITVLVLTAGGSPEWELTERRVVFTLVGVGVLVAGAALVEVVRRRRTATAPR